MTAWNFKALADELLKDIERLLPLWLPGGSFEGKVRYGCSNLSGGENGSLKVTLESGAWYDFATGEGGGDLLSLYAAIHSLTMGQAAKRIAEEYHLEHVLGMDKENDKNAPAARPLEPVQAPAPTATPKPAPQEPENAPTKKSKKDVEWRVFAPVPEGTPKPPHFRHWEYGEASMVWEYHFEGQFYGYVCRFDRINSKGEKVKEILPYTWCFGEGEGKGAGSYKWHWKQWEVPRPLYVPLGEFTQNEGQLKTVALVEGEKCADTGCKAFNGALAELYDLVSWSGGANAHGKADWSWIRGREVIMWPDADMKRERLTQKERKDGVDPNTKPILPLVKQPGYKAMAAIGTLLMAEYGCTVRMVPMIDPTIEGYCLPDGFDIADAITGVSAGVDDGNTSQPAWTLEQVKDYLASAQEFVPGDDVARSRAAANVVSSGKGNLPLGSAGAGLDKDEPNYAWKSCLVTSATGVIKPIRENIVLALDGWPEKDIDGIAEIKGLLAYNEFTNDLMKMRPTPWGTDAGKWAEIDELHMGGWLMREHGLPSVQRTTLTEAAAIVADRYRYHPVREYLSGLKWDRQKRLYTWLRHCCMDVPESGVFDDNDPLQQYLARAGAWFIQAMVARVMEPGCKFDYMLILEGPQGRYKSTTFKVLAGDWFADTGLNLGDKDSLQQLQGRWLYEIAELDAFGKADITKIKQYTASSSDYFRASFDRRARDYPRQVVFGGTTNERHYLTDPTGNRRFWPVKVEKPVDIDWLQQNRDQLFAEALERWRQKKRMYPNAQEQRDYFEPQQNDRMVDNAIESKLVSYLYPVPGRGEYLSVDEEARKDIGVHQGISLVDLLGKIGIGIERLTPGKQHEKQVAVVLRKLEWVERRSSAPGRPRLYWRPAGDWERFLKTCRDDEERLKQSTQDKNHEDATDDCPV